MARALAGAGGVGVALVAALATVPGPAPLTAQAVEPRTPVDSAVLGGRVDLQFALNSVDGVPQTEFLLRRARLWAATRINYVIDGAVELEAGWEGVHPRFAFIRFSLNPAFRVSLGQFKRAFDLFELTSSSQTLVIERDGFVRGADPCAGIGGLCSYSSFAERLEFAGHDIGALVQGEVPGGRFRYYLSVTNGTGLYAVEENHTKSASIRLEVLPASWLAFGLNAAAHDFPNSVSGQSDYAPGLAADIDLGDFERGPHVQIGGLFGDNWRQLDVNGEAARFLTAQGIASWRAPTPGLQGVEAIEPVARVSWGDPNLDVTPDAGWLFTPGFVLHFQGRNKIAVNWDYWRPAAGARVWSAKVQSYLYF